MDRLKMQTPNLTDENIKKIAQLFPNVITEIEDGTTKDTCLRVSHRQAEGH